MKIAVFGATGATGQQFIAQALAREHHISALARSPQKLALQHPRLEIVQGDALAFDAVCRAVQQADAVFCALGSGQTLKPTTIRVEGMRQIVRALQAQGSRAHVVVLSSLGAGDSRYQIAQPYRLVVRAILRNILADHEAQEAVARDSGLPWTIVRPTGLNNDAPAGGLLPTLPPQRVATRPSVARADVAAFALTSIETRQYLQQVVTLTALPA